MTVDTSYLTTQVNNIVAQLHSVFDDIGVPGHERDSREAEVGCYPCIPGARLGVDVAWMEVFKREVITDNKKCSFLILCQIL